MVASRAALATILGVVVAACAVSPGPSRPRAALPSGAPEITTVPDVPSPSAVPSASPTKMSPASPTPSPLTVGEAGAALFAAEGRLAVAAEPLSQKYLSTPCVYATDPCTKRTEMAPGKEYWAAKATMLSRYFDEVKAIRFPDIAASEAAAHIKATGIARDRALSASKATTVNSFNTRKAAAWSASDTYESNHNLHVALGLPEP
jgi:hypothetical protein